MTPCPAPGREHPPETVWRAQELYCVARLPYGQVAQHVGVAASTLKRWGKDYGWAEKREALAKAEAEIRADTVLARSEMIKELMDTRNPIVGFAVAKLEELALKQAEFERESKKLEAEAAPQIREINSLADAAAALKEAIEIKLGRLLAQPEDVDLKAVKDIKEAMGLIAKMTPQKGRAGKVKGVSKETIEHIQKELLGM
jgi:transposase-like protein